MGVETATQYAPTTTEIARRLRRLPLWLFAALASLILIRAAGFDTLDVAGYHCYALAFWGGAQATAPLPADACLVPQSALAAQPFHTLPVEYGPLALVAFLPPLLLPSAWYNLGFFVEMALIIVGLTWLLACYGAPGAGYAWLIYTIVGDWVPAGGRYDVLPAACVVVALVATRRGRLPWAYVALALGTLLKLYPVVLLPLLLIESWRARDREPLWRGPMLFAAFIALVEGLAVALNPASVLSPVSFMGARCVEIESFPATLGYVWAHLVGASLRFPYAYNSTCEQTAGIGGAQVVALALGLIGMGLALALFWRRRLTLGAAALLMVAALIIGSKVFSPQYLLWLSPLVALEYGVDAAALLGWGAVCLWTTICFPLSFVGVTEALVHLPAQTLAPVTAGIRNLLIVALGGALLWRHSHATAEPAPAALRTGGAS